MGNYPVFLLAYFLGAIPFAYLAGLSKHIDVRKHGSGNIGTTNAFRLLGPKLGIAVLCGDALKGALAAGLSYHFFGPWGGIAGGLLAMAGHSWNPFFRFQPSGKGVAAGLGIIAVLMPRVTLAALAVFLILVLATRYVSLGSAAAALTVAVSVLVLKMPLAYRVFGVVAASVVLIRHRTNFQRILQGTEHKIGKRKR
ncbi:Glycerol-3-phosphate acyltransferase [plsY] [Acididesulfobacillus acetoxydans]|uniref:Glycerol-3-phosphate acyltransferase n=1 Tax=Acididesulfobacillus acetoxydans TaxID=1561005 RepID=A0A8S0XY17_9FIRM|nr:glycerol-3-phosphate 1-O-acyltransferase PlsY [Acididesulfobacillus acetoxydans]CAA7602027.1 Glycerol-3-phosphate acyltransferase [plsY] [Acididesulfobacillus acetoxydans]CEJ08130.1 Glycerol-3-phosphate acyltransferase 2 [Acididesulfobacillus acetoxydans]